MSMNTEMKNHAEWQALLEKKEDEITALQRQVDWLTQQLRLTQGQRFGASSERTQVLSEQFSLFNEAEAVALPDAAEPDLEQITYKRKKRKGKREADFSGLPTEQIIHELPEEERICPECGGPLHECGHAVLRRELTYIPAHCKLPPEITVVGCWAHMRRKFTDLLESLPKEVRARSPGRRDWNSAINYSRWRRITKSRGFRLTRGSRPGWSDPSR